jgi:hypothetical protein
MMRYDFSHLAGAFGDTPRASTKRVIAIGHIGIWAVSIGSTIVLYASLDSVYGGFFSANWARLFVSASYFCFMMCFYYALRAFLNKSFILPPGMARRGTGPLKASINLTGLPSSHWCWRWVLRSASICLFSGAAHGHKRH